MIEAAVVIVAGALILLAAGLPSVLKGAPLSLPMVLLLLGIGAGRLLSSAAPDLASLTRDLARPAATLVLLVSLLGAGLKIDRPFSLSGWSTAWRLLFVGMPLTVLALAAAAHFISGLPWLGALLLGAVLAPTDPVLAASVEVGPPGRGREGEVRFGLTAEAGFNDGLASPLVLIGVALTQGAAVGPAWIADQFAWRVALGAGLGWALGRAAGWALFRIPGRPLSASGHGMVALGIVLICFGALELVHGNGFVGVFVAALSLRAYRRDDPFHVAMAEFAQQIQMLLVLLLLLLFGADLGAGALAPVRWPDIGLAAALLLVVRPASGWLALVGSRLPWRAKALIAFFGVRGIGALYYLSVVRDRLGPNPALDGGVAVAVAGSILLHGATSSPLLRWAGTPKGARQACRSRV